MKRFGSIGVVTLCLAPVLAHAEEDLGEKKHKAMLAEVTAKSCVPPASVTVSKADHLTNTYRLTLGTENNALVLCASRGSMLAGPDGPPFACWTVDAAGKLATTKPTILPGMSFSVPSACGFGYCRPKQKPAPPSDDIAQELVGFSTDGTRVATTDNASQTIGIFDAKTKAFQRQFKWFDGTDDNAFGYDPQELLFMNDFVFVPGYAAGPDGIMWKFSAGKGGSIGGIDLNLSGGSYKMQDPTHLVVRDAGFAEVTIDTTTGKETRRAISVPKACTKAQFDAYIELEVIGDVGDGPKPPKKCVSAIKAAQKTLWKPDPTVGFTSFGGKGYKIEHGAKATLLLLDPAKKKPTSIALKVCKAR